MKVNGQSSHFGLRVTAKSTAKTLMDGFILNIQCQLIYS